jgi:pyruvate,water dikinase
VLLGPGRWGSRGDIRLGVNVTYADISNTAVLLEVARQRGGYVPELSFGTHFFQDLVEGGIRYLPLYPDEPGVRYDELFLRRARNILPAILPEFAHLADVLRVIDVTQDEGVGIFADPSVAIEVTERKSPELPGTPEEHWRWRLRMAERIGQLLDPRRFGVEALYVFGSTKNATAGPASDLDLIVHFGGTEEQRAQLSRWLEGWSLALSEVNYLRTGYASTGLLDVHFVSDEDIEQRTSYASKIGAVTDAARPLPLGSG